jgi:predicted negative regulator of RcsB-dependent stress response
MSKRLASLFCLGLLLVGSQALLAQAWAGRGRINARVVDPEGTPIVAARVTLSLNGEGPDPLETDDKGRFSYLGLAGGGWLVTVEYPGYLVSEGTFGVSEFGGAKPLTITLKPIPEEVLRKAAVSEALQAIERGNVLLAEGDPAGARAEYEKAMAEITDEDSVPILIGVARSYFQEGDKVQTEATLKRILEIDEDQVDALKLLSNYLMSEGREAEAQAYIARLPEGELLDANVYLNLGIGFYNEGKLDEALAEFNKVVEAFPENAEAYYYRGLVRLNQSDNEGAAADFKRLIELEPESAHAQEGGQFLEYLEGGGS